MQSGHFTKKKKNMCWTQTLVCELRKILRKLTAACKIHCQSLSRGLAGM